MNILFLTHRLPCPPDRGCKLRSAAILHGLARRHDVWCAGFLDGGKDSSEQDDAERSLTALRHLCRGVLAIPFRSGWAGYKALGSLLAGRTATEGYFSSRKLAECVRRWAGEVRFDALFAFSSCTAPLALTVPASRRVLCMDDLDSRKWRELAAHARWPMRLIYDAESRRLARRELEWIDRFEATLMISQREVDLVGEPRLRKKVGVFPPILPDDDEERANGVSTTGSIVGFVGAMDYEPNVDAACWLAHEIWPRIRRCCPEAQLWIVGRSPTKAVRDLAADESITVTGTVSDVNEYLQKMRVHVAPLRIARGVQMKVIAAMAAGRPCVVTSGVADGIEARDGRELLVADSPACFSQHVVDLLDHPDRAAAIGRAGRAFLDHMRPRQAMDRLERLLAGEPVTAVDDAESPDKARPAEERIREYVPVC